MKTESKGTESLKKHKNKIIAAVVIIAVLAGAWFYGGTFNAPAADASVVTAVVGAAPIGSESADVQAEDLENQPNTLYSASAIPAMQIAETERFASELSVPDRSEPNDSVNTQENVMSENAEENAPETRASADDEHNESKPETQVEVPAESADSAGAESATETTATVETEPVPEATSYITTNYGNVQELSATEPPYVPESQPAQAVQTPQGHTVNEDGSFMVYLTVRVDTILNNMNLLCTEKHELVPANGVIFPMTAVEAFEGESVFNVLQREMRRARIHMVSRFTPIFNSAYVEAIHNLFEFDVGELSGWMYSVNGDFPNFGASLYILQPGDVIEWHYTCDLGRDLGVHWVRQG